MSASVGFAAEPTHERQVIPGGPGGNRLAVDVALLAGTAANLGDLRLFSADGEEVPCLLVGPPRAEPVWRRGRLLPIAQTRETSGFEVDLGQALRVDRLELSGIPAPFLKRVRLEGGGDRSRWTLLVAEGTLFDLPEEGLSQTTLGFTPGEYRYLRLRWDDRRSGRVQPPRAASARLEGGPAPPPVLLSPLPFERRASEPGTSRFRLHLPAAGLPVVALELEAPPSHLLRPAQVSEGRLSENEIRPHRLGAATLRRVVRDGLVVGELRIAVERPREAELELAVDDGDNPPLELGEVRAVFAPQPWVYFESLDGRPLVARYGVPGQGPPRYDLAALRGELEANPGARVRWSARWGPERTLHPAAPSPVPLSLVSAGAPIDRGRFRFHRSVPGGAVGLCALPLDAAVLAGSRDLADVRLVGSDERQVPYIVERLAAPLVLPLPPPEPAPDALPRTHPLGLCTLDRLALPYPTLPAARLTLTTTVRVFERPVSLLRRRPPQGPREEASFDLLTATTWRHVDPDTPPPPLTLELPRHAGSELILAQDSGDNLPLPLASPTLYLPAVRLRFVRSDEEGLELVYGRSDVSPPRYDLALLAPRLLGAAATEVELGAAEERPAGAARWEGQRLLFWSALGLAVVALLALVVRLVRRG